MFDNIYKLDGVPVVTVQLRYNGWVTELQDLEKSRQLMPPCIFSIFDLFGFRLDNLKFSPLISECFMKITFALCNRYLCKCKLNSSMLAQ